jgi:hypothetical protein
LFAPETVVFGSVPSGSAVRHEERDGVLGWLTTTRGGVTDAAPVTVVLRVEAPATDVLPLTAELGASHRGSARMALGTAVAGAHPGSG